MSVTDRQTDRRTTDGWATAYSKCEHEFTFSKNAFVSHNGRNDYAVYKYFLWF